MLRRLQRKRLTELGRQSNDGVVRYWLTWNKRARDDISELYRTLVPFYGKSCGDNGKV